MNKTESHYYGVFLMAQHLMEMTDDFNMEAYDIVWASAQVHYTHFLKSEYNLDTKSEYECITNYVSNTFHVV